MGILSQLEGSWPPADHDDFWYRPAGSTSEAVTPDTAVGLTAVWAAVNIVSGTLGSLPAEVHRSRPGRRGKDLATDHPLFPLLRWQPNPWQTAFEFFEMGQTHKMLRGNAVSWIVRSAGGVPMMLIPWHPDKVVLHMIKGTLVYELQREVGGSHFVHMENIWHVRGPHGTGLWAPSPIRAHVATLGRVAAAEAYGARFFENDATPNGVLKHPGTLPPKARKNLEESWARAQGRGNQHTIAVLEEGLEFAETSISPEDAQALETMRYGITDVARIFGVPVHLLKELTNSHFNNVTEQNRELVRDTTRPVAIRWEQQGMRSFFPQNAGGLSLQFQMDALLRGDPEARAKKHEIELRSGAITLDEWREEEGRNPHEDEAIGRQVWVSVNLLPAELALEPPESTDTGKVDPEDEEEEEVEEGDDTRRGREFLETRGGVDLGELRASQVRSLTARLKLRDGFRRLFLRAGKHIVDREVNNMRRAVKANEGNALGFTQRVTEYYDGFTDQADVMMRAVVEAYAEQVYAEAHREAGGDGDMPIEDQGAAHDYSAVFAVRHTNSSKGQLLKIVRENGEGWEAKVGERLDEWKDKRSDKVADRERVQSESFFALLAYGAMNVQNIRWVTFGENCPLCQRLSGKVVGRQQPFVGQGETLVGDETTKITPRRVVRHAPLHSGCDCGITVEN